MKTFATLVGAVVLLALLALAWTFTAETLPVTGDYAVKIPAATPPPQMKLAALFAGTMDSQAMFAYRGGKPGESRVFGMGGILVRHPQGTLLFDTGFGHNVDQHFLTTPFLMQATSKYHKETPVAEQLKAAGISLSGIVLTHAHWDHVSGIEDLPGVPVWVDRAEMDFIHSDAPMTALMRSFNGVQYQVYDFKDGPYLGFDHSLDVFGDGSVVLVPAAGHTPGSIIAFVSTPDGKRYALLGDLVWQKEGLEIPAERPWLPRRMVDWDEQAVRGLIVRMYRLQQAMPNLIMVPAHDRRVWEQLPKL